MSEWLRPLGGVVLNVGRAGVWAVGGVVGGAAGLVRHALVNDDEDEDEDGPNMFEQRARVDQVLHFFEAEFFKYDGYIEDAERLEAMRVDYYNCINAIEFQNELLSTLVEDLLGLRAQLRGDPSIRSNPDQLKEIGIRLASIKLDIGDRKNKRFFKEKERKQLLEALSPVLADIKMRRLLAEQEAAQQQPEDTPDHLQSQAQESRAASPNESTDASSSMDSSQVWGSQAEIHQTTVKSRRRYKHYSDAELSSLLREKDS
mmetsp:Transcript_48017/g.114125  ORF Transcript_48017/g.114125 Transcript_48017/m.114125 type:complete len:259 (+) Transcript_48017:91-867(+)